jgi:site-specific DNA recombinase
MDRLLSHARQHEYEIPAELQFVDQAVSGKQLARPGLDRLRDAAAAGAFTTLLCLSPDRLARNLGAQQVVLDELRRADVTVLFLDQPSLGDTPQAKLLVDIQGAFAEYERVLISDRMRRGRLYHLRQGQAVPYPAPYGYRYQPAQGQQAARWQTEPAEAAVVEQAFVWYTQDGLSLGELAQRLNRRQVPGPDGPMWHPSTLGRLLRQPAYRYRAESAQAVRSDRCVLLPSLPPAVQSAGTASRTAALLSSAKSASQEVLCGCQSAKRIVSRLYPVHRVA